MSLVFSQILVILLYVLTGYAAGKLGLISPAQRKYLTRLCSSLILPFTILSATSLTVSGEQLMSIVLVNDIRCDKFMIRRTLAITEHKNEGD